VNYTYICSANYLDGTRIKAYGPLSLFIPLILYKGRMKLIIGKRYASVLPYPVGAIAIKSLSENPIGIACI